MKKTLQRSSILAALVLAAGLSSQYAMAATTTGTIGVTATVGANCLLSTVPITFGVYDPLSATPLNATGQVQLACTVGAAPAIALDVGLNSSAGQRRLINGATNFLNYNVFQPSTNAAGAACAYTTAFATTVPGFALTAAPSTASRSYNICGQVPAGQSAPNGTYADTITATITF